MITLLLGLLWLLKSAGNTKDQLGQINIHFSWIKKIQITVSLYSNVFFQIPLESFRTSLPVNGSLTVNENIADNGGIKAAFYAWEMLKRYAKPADQRIFGRVKGLEKYNPDQLFFINYAFVCHSEFFMEKIRFRKFRILEKSDSLRNFTNQR